MNDPKVFLNFRNGDGQHAAAHVYSALTQRFDKSQIFRSSESIEIGDDFVERLSAAPRECEVLLAFIGRHWLEIRNARGERRLFDADDWVRREIAAAIDAGRRVAPILLDGAALPARSELPEDIAKLPDFQYVHFDARDTRSGIDALIRRLEAVVPELKATPDRDGDNVQHNTATGGGILMAPNGGDINIERFNPTGPS